jgi:hypothetical protein
LINEHIKNQKMADNFTISQDQENDVDASIRKNNYKLTADKIKRTLNKLRDKPSISYRRWIWELMQNAKDVRNRFEKVSVQIVLENELLEFKHNGDPFFVGNITGLIQQVSSKASDGSDEEVTGKFGTGFIITHLLSDLIKVNGVVQRPGNIFRAFEIDLDRAGQTSEELLPKIETATEHIRQIDNNTLFPIKQDYQNSRKETDYDTIFTYYLSSEEKKKAARTGIEDLQNTLPLTLANLSKIKKVEVVDKVENKEAAYECLVLDEKENPTKVIIKAMWDAPFAQRHFLKYKTDQLALITEVSNFEDMELIAYHGKQPNLYRDFPLIGSEKFHFPFVLNGFHFFPTDDRSSVFLNSEESKEALANRDTIKAAQLASIEFTKLLINDDAKNLYHLAYTRMPEVHFEETTKTWYQQLQNRWRKELLDLPLVETEGGAKAKLKDCCIPYYGSSDEVKLAFYDLVLPFLGHNKVPKKEFLLEWIKAVGPKDEIDTWQEVELYYSLERFVEEIQLKKESSNIELDTQQFSNYSWLNKVYTFIYIEKQTDLLSEFAIVPNQYGFFKSLSSLFEEDKKSPIPDHFLDILKTLDEDWREEMINRQIIPLPLNHEKRGISKISSVINEYLKGEKTSQENSKQDFLKHASAEKVLIDILKVFEPQSTLESFRYNLYKNAKDILHFEDDYIRIPDSGPFNFSPAIKLMIRLVNKQIETSENIQGLSSKLTKTEEQTVLWLDNYLRLLQGNSEYKQYLEQANIIPNRYYQFCAYDPIHAFGTNEQPLDDQLLDILKSLNPKEDWREYLIGDGIGISLSKSKKFDELCTAIWGEMMKVKGDESYQDNREQLLDFIEWGENHENKANIYFQGFKEFADRVFFILMIERSTHGKQVMKILKSEEQVEALAVLSDHGVDITELVELAGISQELGTMEKVIEFANGLIEEKRDFEFLKNLGEQIEDIFKKALSESELGYQDNLEIEHKSIGASDFIVRNLRNQKEFHVELKSHAHGKMNSIKLALSQARLCLNKPNQFALCVIERPVDRALPSSAYVKEKIKWVSTLSSVIKEPIEIYSTFNQRTEKLKDATLEIQLKEETKIALGMQFITQHNLSFDELIEHIKRQLH